MVAAATVFAAPSEVDRQQPTFRSGVDIVQVDVVVVDKDGHPVRGLKQSDFAIRDRGKPQAISTFEEIGREPRAAAADTTMMLPTVKLDVASNQTSQSDRLVIMVIDDLHIWKGRTDRAKEISRDVVNRLGPESSMAVLFTSGDHNTTVTTDHSVLLGGRRYAESASVVAPAAPGHRQPAPPAQGGSRG